MAEGKLKKASESEEAAQLRRVIGAGPDEEVLIRTPQFTRTPGMREPSKPPEDFEQLRFLGKQPLKILGCQPWDEPDEEGRVLMLFPGEWYESIPKGFLLESISGDQESFELGVTDNDIRFGCLAFGVRVRA